MSTTYIEMVSLSSANDCVAAIPHLIGFYPSESAVVIWLNDNRIVVTQRADLEPSLASPQEYVKKSVLDAGVDEIIVAFFTEESTDRDLLLKWAESVAFTAGIKVRDVMLVWDGRWTSLACDNPDCCPLEGKPIDSRKVGPEFVVHGVQVKANRESLAAEFTPVGTIQEPDLPRNGVEDWRDKAIDFAEKAYESSDLSPDTLRAIAGSLHDIRVRDTLIWLVTQADDDQLRFILDYAKAVACSSHPDDSAPALTVAGLIAWLCGDGARASIAIGLALKYDEDYSLALLINQAVSDGLPPTAWRDAMNSLTYSDVRNGAK